MRIKVLLILGLIYSLSFAVKCSIDQRIMYSIAQAEKHPNRVVGYQYLISFNNKDEAIFAAYIFPYLFIDTRTIDCEDSYTCADILYALNNYGINNLDCGTYQINTKYWQMNDYEDYFDLKKSYKKACQIIEYHTKDELSWTNIAKYHSGTPKYNEKYKQRLFKYLKQNMKKDKQKNKSK